MIRNSGWFVDIICLDCNESFKIDKTVLQYIRPDNQGNPTVCPRCKSGNILLMSSTK